MTDNPGRQFERLFAAAGVFLNRRDPEEDEEEFLRKHEPLRELLAPMLDSSQFAGGDDAADGEDVEDAQRTGATPETMGGARSDRRYEILEELARGGIGVVYRARDHDLDREVALKTLRSRHDKRTDILRRFEEEARIGGQLQHPGIVPVYDLGRREDTRPFFAMKLVDGETFAELLGSREDHRDRRQHLLTIFAQVCQTMAYAHSRAVVHRDLKPGNIMVGAFGEVQVVDWGFAKVLRKGESEGPPQPTSGTGAPESAADAAAERAERDDSEDGTRSDDERTSMWGTVIGTPSYMPPEQASGDLDRMDERSDVFTLGAILLEILTGRPPYVAEDSPGSDLIALARACDLTRVFAALDEQCSERDLVDITVKCLSASPADRPGDAAVLADRIHDHLESVDARARQAELAATRAELRAEQERRTKRQTLTVAAIVLVTLVAAGGGWLWWEQAEQARLRDLGARVQTTMDDAVREQGQAVGMQPAQAVAVLQRAANTAHTAHALAESGAPGSELEHRARTLRDAIDAQRATTRRLATQLSLQSELHAALGEAIVLDREDFSSLTHRDVRTRWLYLLEEKYPAVFREHGIDVDDLPVDAVVAKLGGNDAVGFASVFDQWALARRAIDKRQAGDENKLQRSGRLIQIARALDPEHRLRNQLRDLADRAGLDIPRLVELAQRVDVARESPAGLMFVYIFLKGSQRDAEASSLLKRSLPYHPGDFAINLWMGIGARQAEPPRLAEAQRHFLTSLDRSPRSASLMLLLGESFCAMGEHESALGWFRRARELSPQNPTAHNDLGVALSGIGNLPGAIEAFQQASALAPDDPGHLDDLGVALLGAGELDDAIAAFGRALALDPNHADAHNNLGVAWSRKGRFDESIREHETALRLDPAHPLARANLARGLLNQAWALVRQGRPEDALPLFERCLELNEEVATAHHGIAKVLSQRGDDEAAAEAFRQSLEADRENASVWVAFGAHLHNKQGKPDEAAPCFRRAIALDARHAAAHFNLGVVLHARNDLNGARKSFLEAIAIRPGDANAYTKLAKCELRQGRLDAGVKYLRQAVALDRGNADLHFNLGLGLYANNDLKNARAAFLEGLKIRPRSAIARAKLASCDWREGHLEAAEENLRRALGIDPRHVLANYSMAVLHLEHGRAEAAKQHLLRALDADPRHLDSLHKLGGVLRAERDFASAEKHYRKFVEVADDQPSGHYFLGLVLSRQEKVDEAIEAYRAAIARDENHALAWSGLGEALFSRIADGGADAMNPTETAYAATAAAQAGRRGVALKLFERAFAKQPSLLEDPRAAHSREAARAALVLAAGRKGAAERADGLVLRAKALTWLQAALEVRRREVAAGRGAEVRRVCQTWLVDRDLGSVREPENLAKLSPVERQAWQELWANVRALSSPARDSR